MWSLLVVVDEPALELGSRLVEAQEVVRPDRLFLVGLEDPFDVDKPTVKLVDDELHWHRIDADNQKVTFRAECKLLPDGVMIRVDGSSQPYLVHGDGIYPWSAHGYGIKARRPMCEVEVLTPRPIVDLMQMEDAFVVDSKNPLLAW